MRGPEDWHETARRVRAAIAFGRLSRPQAAEAMRVSLARLERITGTRGSEASLATWQELWRLADAAGLPPEWFSADLSRLREIVPPGMPTIVTPGDARPTLDDSAAREAIAAAEAGPPLRPRLARGGGGSRRATRGPAS